MSNERLGIETRNSRGLGLLLLLCVMVFMIWLGYWFALEKWVDKASERGQFGDMFGGLNALFAALAFAGLMFTVWIQRQQLALQQRELIESAETQRRLVEDQIAAQERLFNAQKKHADELQGQRRKVDEDVETRTRKCREDEEATFRQNVLRAIRFELDALEGLFSRSVGQDLAGVQDGQGLWTRLAITQNFFCVFEANAVHLGRIEASTSKQIIRAYALLKSFVENFRINNSYLEECDRLSARMNGLLPPGSTDAQAQACTQELGTRMTVVSKCLVRQAKVLKEMEIEVRRAVASLNDTMRRQGIE